MIVRLVKMVFKTDEVEGFKAYIEGKAPHIRNFDGCEYLQMVQDKQHPEIIFTYSHWRDEKALEAYRHSDLFESVWKFTKARFAKRAEAWSMDRFIEIGKTDD